MRLALLLATLLVGGSVSLAEVSFKRVWPGYRTADSFVRLGEYFGAPENPLTDGLFRSDPAERAGYYWLVRTDADADTPAATFELEVILPGTAEPVTRSFPVTIPRGSTTTLIGLTGDDWPAPDARPSAWRLVLRDQHGTTLTHDQSFLWRGDLPPTPAAPASTSTNR